MKTKAMERDRKQDAEHRSMATQEIHAAVRRILKTDYTEKAGTHKNPQYLVVWFKCDYTVEGVVCITDVTHHERKWVNPLTGHYGRKQVEQLLSSLDTLLNSIKGQAAMSAREIETTVRKTIKTEYDEKSDRQQFLRVWNNYDNHIWKIEYVCEEPPTGSPRTVFKVPLDIPITGHYDRSRMAFLLELFGDLMTEQLAYYQKTGHEILGFAIMSKEDAASCVSRDKSCKSKVFREMRDSFPGAEFDAVSSRRKGYSWVFALARVP